MWSFNLFSRSGFTSTPIVCMTKLSRFMHLKPKNLNSILFHTKNSSIVGRRARVIFEAFKIKRYSFIYCYVIKRNKVLLANTSSCSANLLPWFFRPGSARRRKWTWDEWARRGLWCRNRRGGTCASARRTSRELLPLGYGCELRLQEVHSPILFSVVLHQPNSNQGWVNELLASSKLLWIFNRELEGEKSKRSENFFGTLIKPKSLKISLEYSIVHQKISNRIYGKKMGIHDQMR